MNEDTYIELGSASDTSMDKGLRAILRQMWAHDNDEATLQVRMPYYDATEAVVNVTIELKIASIEVEEK